MKAIILLGLLSLTVLGCKQDSPAPATPTESCRLAQFVDYSGTNDFTYDNDGNLSKWVNKAVFDTSKVVNTTEFTRDATGRINSLYQTVIINGKMQEGGPSTTRYTYTDGLLSSANVFYDLSKPPVVTRTLTYNAGKQLVKRITRNNDNGREIAETYEYDARGNCTHYVFTTGPNFTIDRVLTYDTSKNPQQLLVGRIPLNFNSSMPWPVNVAVTTKETYTINGTQDVYSGTRKVTATNASGYVTASTETFDGFDTKETVTLTGCN